MNYNPQVSDNNHQRRNVMILGVRIRVRRAFPLALLLPYSRGEKKLQRSDKK